MKAFELKLVTLALGAGLTVAAAGCTTESYCFSDCEGDGTAAAGGTGGVGGGAGTPGVGGFGGNISIGGFGGSMDGGRPDGCLDRELCNGLDDDCDGQIDEDIDYTRVENCGNCATNCLTQLQNAVDPKCTPPSPADGTQPGTCSFGSCAQDYFDVDGDPSNGCEYLCQPKSGCGGSTTDDGGDCCNSDDDCDGQIDEDVDLCSPDNCGECGKKCVAANATAKCEKTGAPADPCTATTRHARSISATRASTTSTAPAPTAANMSARRPAPRAKSATASTTTVTAKSTTSTPRSRRTTRASVPIASAGRRANAPRQRTRVCRSASAGKSFAATWTQTTRPQPTRTSHPRAFAMGFAKAAVARRC